jgi:hypothetical protein
MLAYLSNTDVSFGGIAALTGRNAVWTQLTSYCVLPVSSQSLLGTGMSLLMSYSAVFIEAHFNYRCSFQHHAGVVVA